MDYLFFIVFGFATVICFAVAFYLEKVALPRAIKHAESLAPKVTEKGLENLRKNLWVFTDD